MLKDRLIKFFKNNQAIDLKQFHNHLYSSLFQSSKLLSNNNKQLANIESISEVEWKAFSQWGEDGIIDWLIENIQSIPSVFIEFGVGDYLESNTRYLLEARNWSGYILDGSIEHINSIKNQDFYWRYNLNAKQAFITKDNINDLIKSFKVKTEVGLLSVDIDGNDYWVWEAIDCVEPYIVICEYNAVLGDQKKLTIPYSSEFNRTNAHHSNLYFGASLKALIHLGNSKGYTFIGTNSNGVNAFFIRNDLKKYIVKNIKNIKSFNSKFRESRDSDGILNYLSARDRLQEIEHMHVIDLETNTQSKLSDIQDIYSDSWCDNQ